MTLAYVLSYASYVFQCAEHDHVRQSVRREPVTERSRVGPAVVDYFYISNKEIAGKFCISLL